LNAFTQWNFIAVQKLHFSNIFQQPALQSHFPAEKLTVTNINLYSEMQNYYQSKYLKVLE